MSAIPDVWPRGERSIANPLSQPFKAAYDLAQDEAKNAWAEFERARDEATKASPELAGHEEALDRLDGLYGAYTALAEKADTAEARWVRSLGAGLEPANGNGKGHRPGKVAQSILGRLDAKALVNPAGAIIAPDLLELIVDEALRARSVLALYTRQTTTGDELRYLQSTVETLAAAPVAAGAAKPVSVLTTAVKSSPVQTIATVSEALDRAVLLDFALFTNWIEGRLRSAVELAIETQTISGNGTAPNLRGILNTAGIGVAGPPTAGQTAADAIAAGLSLLESDEQAASAIVVNPADYWLMRGVREGTGATAGGYLYGDPAGAGTAMLWGVPLVRSTAQAAGTALVGDFRQATLAVREDTTVAWADAHADLFTKNQVVVRVEARIAFFVQRPSAFVNVDLVA